MWVRQDKEMCVEIQPSMDLNIAPNIRVVVNIGCVDVEIFNMRCVVVLPRNGDNVRISVCQTKELMSRGIVNTTGIS